MVNITQKYNNLSVNIDFLYKTVKLTQTTPISLLREQMLLIFLKSLKIDIIILLDEFKTVLKTKKKMTGLFPDTGDRAHWPKISHKEHQYTM